MAAGISYRTIYKSGEGEIQEKKSRFLSFVYNVTSEEEIEEILTSFKKQYWDARHVCYAYVLKGNPPRPRFSDDGEPQGTAGKPMLEILNREGLMDTLLIVVRYFGGVLLGTGGLLRAYTDSSLEAIRDAVIIEKKPAYLTRVSLDYSTSGKMPNILSSLDIAAQDIEYTDVVTYSVPVPVESFGRFQKEIIELTKGGITPEPGDEVYYAVVDGESIIFE